MSCRLVGVCMCVRKIVFGVGTEVLLTLTLFFFIQVVFVYSFPVFITFMRLWLCVCVCVCVCVAIPVVHIGKHVFHTVTVIATHLNCPPFPGPFSAFSEGRKISNSPVIPYSPSSPGL